MNNLLKLGKKIFTVGVVATTIFWSLGVAALVPAVANAASEVECSTLVAGDMVKVAGKAAIWAVNSDKTRSYFPNGDVYKSWTSDNKYSFKTVTGDCMASLKATGAVMVRPGSFLVKESATDKLYVTLPGNKLAEVSVDAAKALYGASYASAPAKGGRLLTMDDATWVNYSKNAMGAKVTEVAPTEGSLVKVGSVYYVVGANKSLQEVTATGLTANRFQTQFAYALAKTDGFTMGAKVEAEVASLSDRTQGAKGDGVASTPASTSTAPVGDLTVSLSSDTPAAATLSAATVYNNVLTLKFTAGNQEATLKGLTVKKAGLVSNSNITGVSVWVDGYRKGDVMSSFNSDNKVSVGFANSPVVVPANSSKMVSVALNLSSTVAGGTVAAQIAAAADIDTKASVGGTFPITGNTFGITDGSASLASVKVEGQSVGGQSTEPVASDSGQLEIGQTKEIAKYKFTENGTNDATIDKVIFYVAGTVKEKDLQNFEMYGPDNALLGSAPSISDRYVTIKFNTPYKLAKGTNRTLTLKATAMDGAGNWFAMQIQSESDLMVKDGGNAFYVLPTNSGAATWYAATSTSGYFKLKAGALTIVKNATSPSANLAAGSSNVLLGKFDVKAVGEAIEVRKLYLQIATTSAATTRLSGNVKIVVDGSTVLTQSAAANAMYAASTQYTLSQYVTIKSGETKVFEVYGDVASNAAATSQYQAKIGKAYVKRLSTLDYVDNQPNDLYSANNLSLGGNTPTIAKDTSLGNKTLSPGGDPQVLGQWVVKAPESEDVNVTAANFIFTASGLTVATYLQNLALYSGTTQLGSTQSVVASTSNAFTFTLNVPKNTTKVLTLKGLIVSTALTGKNVSSTISSLTYIGQTTNNSTDDTTGYQGQVNTINNATVTMSAASDATTVSSVRLPSASEVQLGKWKVNVSNQDVTFNKLRLYLDDETGFDTSAGNFGTLSIYEEGKETAALAVASYLPGTSNGYVEFTGMNWTVPAGSIKYLVLKGPINSSGTMNEASYNAWALGPTSTTNFDVTAGGSNVSASSITVSSPTSTYYLFHNSAPKIVKASIGTSLDLNSQAKIFSFTVYNNGDREMTLSTTSVYVSVSGLTSAASATGTISSFKLWNANASGGLGTNLASASTAFGSACLAGAAGVSSCTVSNSTTTVFGGFSETVTVAAGASRTFIVTADTTDVLDGKSQGTVSVSAMLDGSTGYNSAGDTTGQAETSWAAGKLLYFYTPVGGSQNGTAYGASDSYDVVGDTMTRGA